MVGNYKNKEEMKTKFTKGDWQIQKTRFGTNVVSGKIEICQLTSGVKDVNIANAKLIAAAPELLNVLYNLMGMEAWITDIKIKEHFIKTVYPIIRKAAE